MVDCDVVVAGAGLGGLCFASALRRASVRALVLERDKDLLSRAQGYRININVAGDAALRECLPSRHYDLYRDTSHRQMDPSVDIFSPELKPVFRREAEVAPNGPPPAAVDRATLRAILLDAAQNVRFGAVVADAAQRNDEVEVLLADGSRLTAGLLVAADGASSVLRRALIPGHDPQPLGTVAIYGKTPLDTKGLTWLPCGVLQQRFVGLTDGVGTTLALGTWYPRFDPLLKGCAHVPGLSLPHTRPYVMWVLMAATAAAPASSASAGELHRFAVDAVENWHPAAVQFVRCADVEATFRIPLRAMSTVPTWPTGRITFLGDAVHAMSPAGGEGANTAMVDAASLASAFATEGMRGIAAYETDLRQRAHLALQRSANYGRPSPSKVLHHA